MKILIVDDDFTTRLLLQAMLKNYGMAHIAVNGREAVDAVRTAIDTHKPYNLICLDIMMPGMDGQAALKQIREMEEEAGVGRLDRAKIVMTTSLGDQENVLKAIAGHCDGYLVKPYSRETLHDRLRELELIF